VPPARYEVGFYVPEDGILNNHLRENLKSYKMHFISVPVICFISSLTLHYKVLSGDAESRNGP
jgi:hypothetical protein